MIVADGSALLAALAVEPAPSGLIDRLVAEDELHVPHLVDVEFLNALRRLLGRLKITQHKATDARIAFLLLPLVRYSHQPFANRIWQLRFNLNAYDAAYVALAEALDAPLVSCDQRLRNATGHRAAVQLFE